MISSIVAFHVDSWRLPNCLVSRPTIRHTLPYTTIRRLNCTNKSQIVCWILDWMKPESDNIWLCAQRTSGKCWFITPNKVPRKQRSVPTIQVTQRYVSSLLGLDRCLMESVSKFSQPVCRGFRVFMSYCRKLGITCITARWAGGSGGEWEN